jgi:hypothetical protein
MSDLSKTAAIEGGGTGHEQSLGAQRSIRVVSVRWHDFSVDKVPT